MPALRFSWSTLQRRLWRRWTPPRTVPSLQTGLVNGSRRRGRGNYRACREGSRADGGRTSKAGRARCAGAGKCRACCAQRSTEIHRSACRDPGRACSSCWAFRLQPAAARKQPRCPAVTQKTGTSRFFSRPKSTGFFPTAQIHRTVRTALASIRACRVGRVRQRPCRVFIVAGALGALPAQHARPWRICCERTCCLRFCPGSHNTDRSRTRRPSLARRPKL